jgi:hypothetical protein
LLVVALWRVIGDVSGGSGAGVTAVGAIDSQTKSANGAVISGGSIYLQTADNTNVGLVSTGAQTFAGAKTFNGGITLGANLSIGSNSIVTSSGTITAAELDRLTGKDAALVDTNDAVNTAITGTGALNNGSITSGFGSIDTGADNITTSGTVAGGTVNATANLQTAGTNRIDASGNLVNIGNVTGTGAVTVASTGGANALTLSSGSGTIILGATTSQKNGTGYTYDVNNGIGASTFTITNSGAGVASLSVEGGATLGANLNITNGGATISGNSTIAGTLTSLTGLTSSGTINFSGLSTGLVQSASGVLSAGAVDRNSSTFFNTTLTATNGGTGHSTTSVGDLLVGAASNTFNKLAIGGVNTCLISNGTTAAWGSCTAGGGGFSSLSLAGTSGTPQTITDTDTITVAAGSNITTTAGATDTVTVDVVSNPTFSGLVTASNALTVSAGGASISGGINNNNGGLEYDGDGR